MITSYDTMPFGVYNAILDILDDKDRSPLDQQVAIVAALCGCSEQDILDLPVPEFKTRTHALAFLEAPPPEPHPVRPASHIRLGVMDLRLVPPEKMNTAQFVDFEQLVKAGRKAQARLIAVFLVPPGKTYGHTGDDDPHAYDVDAVADAISRYLTVSQVEGTAAFFWTRWSRRLLRSLTSLTRVLERMARKIKDPALYSEMQQRLTHLRRLGDGLTRLLTSPISSTPAGRPSGNSTSGPSSPSADTPATGPATTRPAPAPDTHNDPSNDEH